MDAAVHPCRYTAEADLRGTHGRRTRHRPRSRPRSRSHSRVGDGTAAEALLRPRPALGLGDDRRCDAPHNSGGRDPLDHGDRRPPEPAARRRRRVPERPRARQGGGRDEAGRHPGRHGRRAPLRRRIRQDHRPHPQLHAAAGGDPRIEDHGQGDHHAGRPHLSAVVRCGAVRRHSRSVAVLDPRADHPRHGRPEGQRPRRAGLHRRGGACPSTPPSRCVPFRGPTR